MGEHAGIWQRVSTDAQDEGKQLADLERWAEQHEYQVTERYALHGKSAFHGKQLPELERAMADIESGKIAVLVAYDVSRLSRRKSMAEGLRWVERAEAAGGRIEFTTQTYLNLDPSLPEWVRGQMLAQAFGMAHASSEEKSRLTNRDIARHRETDSAHGRPAWGFTVEGVKDAKVYVPTAEAERYVPVIWRMAIDGATGTDIAAWLDSEGVGTRHGGRWNESAVSAMLRNPMYKGMRRNGGDCVSKPLVSPTTWDEARLSVASRARRGRSGTTNPKTLAQPVCSACYGKPRAGCPYGISPMYPKTNASGARVLRCEGSGPQRRGCGAATIDLAA